MCIGLTKILSLGRNTITLCDKARSPLTTEERRVKYYITDYNSVACYVSLSLQSYDISGEINPYERILQNVGSVRVWHTSLMCLSAGGR